MAAAAGPAAESRPPLYVALLGPPMVTWQGQPRVLARRQARALLYRIAAAVHPVPRDQLCFLFWPDQPDSIARRCLSNLLNQLRRALPEPDALVASADVVALNRAIAGCDVAHGAWVAPCPHREQLQQASALYRGAFLDGFSLPDSPEFDIWRNVERHAWERRLLDMLARLVEQESAAGNLQAAIAAAARYLAVDPLAEGLHRRLMALYAAQGDRAAALDQFAHCRAALACALGVDPLPATRAVFEAVRDGHRPPDDAAVSARGDAGRLPSPTEIAPAPLRAALPATVTPLIGRAAEVHTACALLVGDDTRWLTLTGPGGAGKTRLAVGLGHMVGPRFADGTVWVPLAPLRDPAHVADAIVQACGLPQTGQAPRAQLCAFVRDKHLLLVLDNFEHLLPAAPLLAELLAAGPRLHLLVTSRALLNRSDEHVLPVPPLPLPELERLPSLDLLAQQPAVALLLARICQHQPDFRLTTANAADLAAICVRLDGLPLALELAAARLRLLSPRALLRRLDHCLALLEGGPRDLPARQHTLRATIAWSYGLLAPREQRLFAQLAVFVDGAPVSGIAYVESRLETAGSAAASSPEHAGRPVLESQRTLLDSLQRLQDSHLIVWESGAPEPRWSMLETIRAFALEQLAAHGDAGAVRLAHARWSGEVAATHGPGMHWPWQPGAQAALLREYHNIRTALHWSTENGHPELGARICCATYPFWELSGRFHEAHAAQAPLLAVAETLPQPLRSRLQAQAAFSAFRQGSFSEAAVLAATVLGDGASAPADRVSAERTAGLAALELGDHERALRHFERAMAGARAQGMPVEAAGSQSNIGLVLLQQGQLDAAEQATRASYAGWQALGYPRGIGLQLVKLGAIQILRGQANDAAPLLHQAVRVLAEAGDTTYLLYALLVMSAQQAVVQQAHRAVTLYGATSRHAAATGVALANRELTLVRSYIDRARAQLAPEAWERAWNDGQALSLAAAVAYALAGPAAGDPTACVVSERSR